MAKESFDKEVQFLRMLVLTSGAYSRQQFADKLGISIHTFDKTIKNLKNIVNSMSEQLSSGQSKEFAETLRYNYLDSANPALLFLFRAKSLKESEIVRISLILTTLQHDPLTANEVLDACYGGLPVDSPLPDEKTIRPDLKYLEQVGVIRRLSSSRPYRYRIHDDLITKLSTEELHDLYDFIDIMANTQVPSVQGYLLRDGLRKHLARNGTNHNTIAPFLYKYHFYSRILAEAHLFTLFTAIRNRCNIEILYFSHKKPQMYASQNTNPLFERESTSIAETILPIKVVYDHQYGRWYLLAHHSRNGMRTYRLDGITQIQVAEQVAESLYEEKRAKLEQNMKNSWLIDTKNPVTVRVKFYNPGDGIPNFVKERVTLQGQWGQITEEHDDGFIYEIHVNGVTEIRPWLRSFGSSCEVLEPKQLRKEMIADWKEIQSYYESIRENI